MIFQGKTGLTFGYIKEVDVTEGQREICPSNVTDGRGFCGVFVTEGEGMICASNVTEGQREKE